MASDTDTIRSILTLAAGTLGFTGAIIAFINSRLQAATTADAKYKLYISLFTFLEVSMWVGGTIAVVAFDSLRVGLWFLLLAYVVHCGLFLRRGSSLNRPEVLVLVLTTAYITAMLLMFMLSRVLEVLHLLISTLAHP